MTTKQKSDSVQSFNTNPFLGAPGSAALLSFKAVGPPPRRRRAVLSLGLVILSLFSKGAVLTVLGRMDGFGERAKAETRVWSIETVRARTDTKSRRIIVG